jgi:hypothetical protein
LRETTSAAYGSRPRLGRGGSRRGLRDSDFLFLIQSILPVSRIHSEQMTTMTRVTGLSPPTIKRPTPSDLHLEPRGKLRAGIGTQLPQESNSLSLSQAVFGNGLLDRSGGPRPGLIPFLARWPRMLVMTRCSRITLTIRISPPQFVQTSGSTSYEVDPLLCECGAEMNIISFITEYRLSMIGATDHNLTTAPRYGIGARVSNLTSSCTLTGLRLRQGGIHGSTGSCIRPPLPPR